MRRSMYALVGVAGTALVLTAAGCGDGSDEPTKAAVNVTENGKGDYSIAFPGEIKGGAVQLTLDNTANKAPHMAQVVQIGEGHTYAEAKPILDSEKPAKIPEWIRGYGGVNQISPGETGTATVHLDEGHYVMRDEADNGAKEAPATEFDVNDTNDAELADTDATVTAATTGSSDPAHEYEWKTDGLKAGENTVTFDSQGKEALHIIAAVPIKGTATIDDVVKDLQSNGPPQSVDFSKLQQTAVLDGDKKEVTQLNLQAGRYAFICFLPDRDEPTKPHFEQGLLSEVTVPSS